MVAKCIVHMHIPDELKAYWFTCFIYICINVVSIHRLSLYCSWMYICNVGVIFAQRHMSIKWNVCLPVVVVTSSITLNSYGVYTLTKLSHMCIWTNCYPLIYVAFEGHICCWYIYGYTMKNKSCSLVILFFLLYVQ